MRERKLTRASIDRLIARSFIKCAGELDWGLDEGELDDGVSIVFARHPEFSEVNVIKYFNTINKDETLKSCSVASPLSSSLLNAGRSGSLVRKCLPCCIIS